MDTICNLLQSWSSGSEMGSADKSSPRQQPSASPPPGTSVVTPDDLAILKKQEAEGKISLHQIPFITTPHTITLGTTTESLNFTISNQTQPTQHRFVYTTTPPDTSNPSKPNQTNTLHQPLPIQTVIDHPRDHNPNFNLSIADPSLIFPNSRVKIL
jgi:hypothetical protein